MHLTMVVMMDIPRRSMRALCLYVYGASLVPGYERLCLVSTLIDTANVSLTLSGYLAETRSERTFGLLFNSS